MATQPKSGTSGGATPPQPCHTSGLANSFILPRLLFTAPYVLVLLWFRGVDVYHRHFSEPGLIVLAYNSFRVLFIFYLFCIIETAGLFLLRAVAGNAVETIGILERLALGFFTGAGVWHVAMFALGYLNLYTWPIAIAISLPLVALSYGDVRVTAGQIQRAISGGAVRRNLGPGPLGWILLGLASLAFIMLLLVKGLYPGGGHDYFTHYFYYFQTVIARGGLWPNDVWYHYYYDKGAGLYFLGILITDPLAPQLVTFCFMAVAALVVFLASRDAAPRTRWPWVALPLFLAAYIYTPGWGQFEITHELTTAFVIAVVWTAAGAFTHYRASSRKVWICSAVSTIAAAVIVTPTIAVFLGAIFILLPIWYLIIGRGGLARLALAFATLAGVLLAGVLVINYATTGLISDQNILFSWWHSDPDKLDRWGALPMVIRLVWGRSGMAAESLPLPESLSLLIQSSRLDLFYPLNAGATTVAIVAVAIRLRTRHWAKHVHAPHQAGILIAAVPVFLVIALTSGRVQPVSFYRYASLAVPLMIVGAIGGWALPICGADERFVRPVRDHRSPVVVLAFCLIAVMIATHPKPLFDTILLRTLRFAFGTISIDTAYTLQTGWPNHPSGSIYPGARGAYAVVGGGVPIWSLHLTSYCMLPDCNVETYDSFALPGWDEVMFGSPADGRRALQASRHNYFLFSRELPLDDYLPLSPLFSPDNIAQNLGVRWTDGTTTLLTWLGPGVQPLDKAWLADYRHAVEESGTARSFPYEAMKKIFARLNATPHPWRPFQLPWADGRTN
jgi:hypothetical protein